MPNWNHIVREHLAALRLPPEREIEIVEELALHLEAAYEDALAAGFSEAEAEARALRSYDWRLLECELSRAEQPPAMRATRPSLELIERKGGLGVESFLQDMRFGARMLVKQPGFTLIAIFTLALGIGANTAIFSVVNAVLLRPLPYSEPDRLVQVWEPKPQSNRWSDWVSYPDFRDWRERNTVFDEIGACRTRAFNLTGGESPESLAGAYVSAGLFTVLGVKPILGRTFLDEEDRPGANHVAVISHGLWQRRFGADPGIVGKTIQLDGESHVVVGVMPPEFKFHWLKMQRGWESEIWIPHGPHSELQDRGSHNFRVVARLKRGVTIGQAQANMDAVARGVAERDPGHEGMGAKVMSLQRKVTEDAQPALLLLSAAIGLVLLIACGNVANLLLAQGDARRHETAIRGALGASPARLVRQSLTESIMLGLLGGGAGLLLAFLAIQFIIKLGPDIPRLDQTGIDPRVLSVTLCLSLLTGLLFGTIPALRSSGVDINDTLKRGGKGVIWRDGAGLRSFLLVGEMALALTLLVGAGLLIRSFLQLQSVEAGFDTSRVLKGLMMLPEKQYPISSQQARFIRQAVERLQALPEVETAAASTVLPLYGNDSGTFNVEGQPAWQPGKSVVYAERPKITPDYFRLVGIRLLQGRSFTWADNENSPEVAIVNEGMARRYWPGEDAIGKRVTIDERDGWPVWRQIVGVVNDVKHDGLTGPARPHIYIPMMQLTYPGAILAVRAKGDPAALADTIRREVAALDRNQPLIGVETMEKVVSDSVADRRFQMTLLAIFAAVALILAATGVYSVMATAVARRTHEIGIRLALGAQPHNVLRLVVGQGMKPAMAGVGIGLAAAFGLTRLIRGLLFGVSALDPLTFIAVALLLAAVALIACYIPARRAMRVDPLTALRSE
ncbi:MAG TPA: ABC transporter permease [Blastocatellia bacterium]|nr:ABC transporter permease [Blastocatellia bacterium]